MSRVLFHDEAFTADEHLMFADWMTEFHRLVTLWLEIRLDPPRNCTCGPIHPEAEALCGIERHLDNAPAELPARRICFRMGGGGMGSIYSPPAIAPSTDDDLGKLEDRLPTEASTSAGVGGAIYDPQVYQDWGWTKKDKRPAPQPEPVPSVGNDSLNAITN